MTPMAVASSADHRDARAHAPGSADSDGGDDSTEEALRKSRSWLLTCSLGIIVSFTLYGVVMEYASSGGRKLHELSLIFVTGMFYSCVAYVGAALSGETPDPSVPKWKMGIIALFSMGSTFTSVRSLRYVIYPVQVLAKSCKPVPVMVMGKLLYNRQYSYRKYAIVCTMVAGVALFVVGGKSTEEDVSSSAFAQIVGLLLLATSLCFDGGTGAYEEALMGDSHIGPFNLMLNIQIGKTVLAALFLIVGGELNTFFALASAQGFSLVMLGITGAVGQVFIFLTIAKFGALTCSIVGLGRKIITLLLSLMIYRHPVTFPQTLALMLAVGAMIMNFMEKRKKKAKPPAAERMEDRRAADAEEVASLVGHGSAPPAAGEGDGGDGGPPAPDKVLV